jgi:hypothetical protein
MFRGNELADAPLIINSIDPCISCMERMMVASGGEAPSVVTKAELLKRCRQKTFDIASKTGAKGIGTGGFGGGTTK